MIEVALSLAFVSGLTLVWMYFGYPVVLWLFVRQRTPKFADPVTWPSVTIMIMTYNEAKMIAEKIRNTIAVDYPQDKLEIMIVDSASTDGTPAIVRQFPQVALAAQPQREGKASAINFGLAHAQGELIVVTDANASMEPQALKAVARHFQDPQVGGVAGSMRQRDTSQTAVSKSGDLYWRVETFLRKRESALHSVIGMSGEISAYRKDIFVREGKVVDWYRHGCTDDFEQTLYIIRAGKQVRYEPEAIVVEAAPDTGRDLKKQKVRIIAQTIHSVRKNLDFIGARWSGWYGNLIFPSRKLLPLLSPWLALLLLGSSAWLSAITHWAWVLFVLQVIFYGCALLGNLPVWRELSIFRTAAFWTTLNWHILVAWLEVWRGKDYTIWDKIDSSRRHFQNAQ